MLLKKLKDFLQPKCMRRDQQYHSQSGQKKKMWMPIGDYQICICNILEKVSLILDIKRKII